MIREREIKKVELAKDIKVDFSDKDIVYITTLHKTTWEIYKWAYEIIWYPLNEKWYRLDRIWQTIYQPKKKKCLK